MLYGHHTDGQDEHHKIQDVEKVKTERSKDFRNIRSQNYWALVRRMRVVHSGRTEPKHIAKRKKKCWTWCRGDIDEQLQAQARRETRMSQEKYSSFTGACHLTKPTHILSNWRVFHSISTYSISLKSHTAVVSVCSRIFKNKQLITSYSYHCLHSLYKWIHLFHFTFQ